MMNRRARSTFAAAILTAALAGGRPAAAQELFQGCAQSIADVELMLKHVAGCRAWAEALPPDPPRTPAAPPKPAQRGRTSALPSAASFIMTALLPASAAEAAAPATPVEVFITTTLVPLEIHNAVRAEPGLSDRLNVYYAYEAFTAGDAGRCAQLSHVVGTVLQCRDLFDDLNFVRARRGPRADFLKTCIRSPGAAGPIAREKLPAWCSLIADHGDNSAALCSKLLPMYGARAPSAASCRARFASLDGDSSPCSALPHEKRPDWFQDDCRGDALFAKASKAKDAAVCAGSQRCRVLMGQGEQVAKELAAGLKSHTAQWILNKRYIVKFRAVTPPSAPETVSIPTPGDPKIRPLPPATPGDPTVRRPDPTPTPASTDVVKSVPTPNPEPAPRPAPPAGFKGFVCERPFGTEENRKALQGVVRAAQMCVTDVEAASPPSPGLWEGVDKRLERLARLNMRLTAAFEGTASAVRKPRAAGAKGR